MVLDRRRLKILRDIFKSPKTLGELSASFPYDDLQMLLALFVLNDYVIAQCLDGTFCTCEKPPFFSDKSVQFHSTTKNNLLFERKKADFWKWLLPVVLSSLAFILSVISLAYTITNHSPILVKVLQ